MKSLIVYYSLNGNTRFISEAIRSVTLSDVLELKPIKEINKTGFMRYLWGGKQVMMKEVPEIQPINIDFNAYDLIFLGTPVWAFSYSPPMATLLSDHKIKWKKVALFCCHGGNKGKTFEKMTKELDGNEVLGEMDFVEPLRKDREINGQKAQEWAKMIMDMYR